MLNGDQRMRLDRGVLQAQEVEVKAKLRSERDKRKAPPSEQHATAAAVGAAPSTAVAQQGPSSDGAADAEAAPNAAPASILDEGSSQAAAAGAKGVEAEPTVRPPSAWLTSTIFCSQLASFGHVCYHTVSLRMVDPAYALQGTAAPATVSPFACIGATMGYSTFHMLQTLWLGVIDLPTNSSEKDWDLQARLLLLLVIQCIPADLQITD